MTTKPTLLRVLPAAPGPILLFVRAATVNGKGLLA